MALTIAKWLDEDEDILIRLLIVQGAKYVHRCVTLSGKQADWQSEVRSTSTRKSSARGEILVSHVNHTSSHLTLHYHAFILIMAPIRKRTALRTRAERSAKDPRGIYAPPAADTATTGPSPADLHTGPSTSNSSLKRTSPTAFGFDDDAGFKVNKKDKRTIRHNVLLAKVQDARVGKKQLKRRRPGKKLKADLGGLADALPEVETSITAASAESADDDEGSEGISEDEQDAMAGVEGLRKAKRRRKVAGGDGTMAMKSLRHRPGAMKRKRKMEQGEIARFGRNLAQMVGRQEGKVAADGAAAGTTVPAQAQAAAGASQTERWKALRSFIGGTMEMDKAFGAGK